MLKLLFFMNVMGSLFFALRTLLFSFQSKYMPPKHCVFLCRLNLMFFLLPFPIGLYFLRRYFDSFTSILPIAPRVRNGTHIIVHLEQHLNFFVPKIAFIEIFLLLTWIVIGLRIFRKYSLRQRKIRKFESFYDLFLEEEMQNKSVNVSKLVQTVQNELELKENIRIFIDEKISSPHIGGISRPILYLPFEWNVSEEVYYMAIRHELAHVKNKDLLFKRIGLVARILHWFNPTVFILTRQMETFAELAADACACNGVSKELQKLYQKALLDLTYAHSNISAMGLKFKRKKKSFTKERIMTMNNKKLKEHKYRKFAALSMISVSLFAVSLLPALAYNLPSTLEIENEVVDVDTIDVFDIDILSTEADTSASASSLQLSDLDLYSYLKNLDFSESNYICIDENGDIFNYDGTEPMIACNHNYLDALASFHDKRADGGCTITYYKSKRCSKCGRAVIMEKDGTLSYVKCPH